jgi:hypothetical protein
MKTIILAACFFWGGTFVNAQKIVPIEYNGKKYEVLDMTAKGKVMWGG